MDLLSVGSRDRQLSIGAHFDFLVLSCVQNLEHVLFELVTGACLDRASLKEHLDITELREVEVALLIERVVLKLQLADRVF